MSEKHEFRKKELEDEKLKVVSDFKKDPKKNKIAREFIKKIDRKKIEDDLFEIYADNKNNSVDMKTIKKNKQGSFFKSFFIFLFSLAFFLLVAWLGFFFNPTKNIFSEDEIKFSVSGEEQIKIGENFTYRINYKNSQNIALKNVQLELRYPKGFVFVTSSIPASDEKNTVWNLENISAFGSGYLDVEGKIFANLDSEQSIRAFLNYIPENFNSEFQKVAHIAIVAAESPLNIEFAVPENISKNSDVEFNLSLAAKEFPVNNLKIVCESENFIFKSSNVESVNNLCEWNIEKIENEENIIFTGSFNEDSQSENNIKLKVFQIDLVTKEEFLIFEEEKKINIIKTDLIFDLAVNGVMSESFIKPGENLNASIVVKNSGETILEDVIVKITIDAPSFDNQSLLKWTDLNVEPYDADVSGKQTSPDIRQGVITWNKNYVEKLAKIMPGEEIFIDFSLPLKDSSNLNLSSFNNFNIALEAEMEYKKGDIKEIKTSNKINFKTISDLELDIMDNISKNTAGNEIHRITWLISNSFHELENLNLSADIYGKVKIDSTKFKNSSGQIDYDETENKISWSIDSLPTDIPDAIIMQFEVEILEKNPSQQTLVSSVNISATDKKTGDIIKLSGEEIKL